MDEFQKKVTLMKNGSPGIGVVRAAFGGMWERTHPHTPKCGGPPRQLPKSLKNIKAGFLFLVALILVGCSSPSNPSPSLTGAIWATNISTSIGSSNKDASQQVISYQITLKNGGPAAITIHSISLLFPTELDKRMVSDRKVTVENTVEPNASITVTGQLTFDASGVSKAQISDWGSPIKGIFATTEQSVFIQSKDR